jgi:hypothetical protein
MLSVFVKRAEDVAFAEVTVGAGASVAALVEAAIAVLRLDASPTAVTLARAAGPAARRSTRGSRSRPRTPPRATSSS